jgi:ribosomal protein S18 acetylase RimI-like enzyme
MKNTSLKIKKAKPQDSSVLAEMNLGLIRDSGHRNPMNVRQLTRRMRGWLKKDYRAYLFEENGTVVGYAVFRKSEEYLYIRQFYTRPGYRRQRVGQRAFEILRKKVWKTSKLLRLDVLVRNVPGIGFWRSVGFKDYCLTLERKNL